MLGQSFLVWLKRLLPAMQIAQPALSPHLKKQVLFLPPSRLTRLLPLLLLFCFAVSACSTTNIVKRGQYIGEDTIKVGMERYRVLTYLGQPKEITRYNNGKTKELFITRQGEKRSSKYLKAAGTAGLAIITFGLSEVATSPATVADKHVSMTVWFDEKKMVEKTKIIKLEEYVF